jgi:GNAT superfamily N-acetyltransferase
MLTLTHLADEAHAGYHALGNRARPLAGGTLITNSRYAQVHDANLLVNPTDQSACAEHVLAQIGGALAPPLRPHVHMGAGAFDALEARLAADGWDLTMTLELVLHDALEGHAPAVDLRPARTEADWAAVAGMFRADHVEEALRDERLPYPEVVTGAVVEVKRAKVPAVRVWIARDQGVDCGFVTSWPGGDGVGMVEDLFVVAEHRRRGIARALIHRAVADARRRGAGPVLIAALVDDTPKDLYRRMGFVPLLMRRCWTAPLPASPAMAGTATGRRRPL